MKLYDDLRRLGPEYREADNGRLEHSSMSCLLTILEIQMVIQFRRQTLPVARVGEVHKSGAMLEMTLCSLHAP